MTDPDPRELYRRWMGELWTAADRELAAHLVTPDFVGHWPDRDVHGPDELATVIAQSLTLFSDVTTTIDVGPIIEGDLLAARWSFHGRYAGGMPGATVAPGTAGVLRGADVLRRSGDRFVEYWVSSDVTQLAAQLGASV